jgi:tripartite-type tricarboxylate transporter receptor subunit TctC
LIAVSSERREPMFPNVPTVAETPGLEGYSAGSWQGIIAPARVAPDIVTKVYNEVRRIVASPDFSEKLTSQGSRPQAKPPAEFGQWLAAEKDKWAKLVATSGLKIE